MKKKICVLLASVMALTALFSACGEKKASLSMEGEPYEIVWYHRQTPTRDQDMVFEEVSKLTKEKINATVTYVPFSSSEYEEKLRLAFASGDDIDICFSGSNFVDYATDGAFYPLGELLETYGKGILEALPEYVWATTTVGDEIYAVPSLKDYPTHNSLWYFEEFSEKYGLDMQAITSLEQLEPMLQKVKEGESGITPLAITAKQPLDVFLPIEKLDGTGFVLGFKTDDYSKLVKIYETEEYKEFFNLMYKWNQQGFMAADAATRTDSQDLIKNMKCFVGRVGNLPFYEEQRNLKVPEEERSRFIRSLSQPTITTKSITASTNAILANSESPEHAMAFLNLLFTDKDVLNTVVYGIEGKHYHAVGENQFRYPEGATGNARDGYYMSAAYQGSRFLLRLQESYPEDLWEQYKEFNDSAVVSPALGFVFDAAPVMNEITAVSNVWNEFIPSLLVGATDPEKYLPQAIEKFEIAGADKILKEAQKLLHTKVLYLLITKFMILMLLLLHMMHGIDMH